MTDEARWVCEKLVGQDLCPDGTRWYIFGSASRDASCPSDVDILVIYEDPAHASIVRARLAELELMRPLHLIFMTVGEEKESGFIASERAVEVFPALQLH